MNAAPGTPDGGLIRDNAELVELTGVSAGPGGDISLNALRSVAPWLARLSLRRCPRPLTWRPTPPGFS